MEGVSNQSKKEFKDEAKKMKLMSSIVNEVCKE
jgi:hypothetical protein